MKINKYGPAHDTARCTLVYPWRPAATDISNRYEALSKRRVFELEREEFQPEARSNQQRATGIMISYWAVYEEFNSVFFIEGCKITKGPPVQVSGGSWSTSRLYQAMLWITWANLPLRKCHCGECRERSHLTVRILYITKTISTYFLGQKY